MILIHTRFAIATLQVWTVALSCYSRTPSERLPRWSRKFAWYIPVIVLLLGKKSNIITPFASQNTVAITLSADGCVFNFFGLGDPGLPTDDSDLNSLAHKNEPKSHLQSPDAKQNHLLTYNASTRRCILML